MLHLEINVKRRHIYALVAAFAVILTIMPLASYAADKFNDVPDSNIFHNDIAWLADAGVTKGCNPPANTEFCPGSAVTREQMAAFMRRLAENKVVDAKTAVNSDMLDGMDPSEYLQLDSVLQPGGTITGTWGVAGNTSGWAVQGIDFRPNIDPAAAITGEYVVKNAYTANCPGDNQAAAGYLCAYEVNSSASISFSFFTDPYSSAAGIKDIGSVLFWSVSGGNDFARGNWALTAPLVPAGTSSAATGGPAVP